MEPKLTKSEVYINQVVVKNKLFVLGKDLSLEFIRKRHYDEKIASSSTEKSYTNKMGTNFLNSLNQSI